MNGAKLTAKEITNLIFLGIKQNNLDVKEISSTDIEKIIYRYKENCNSFQGYVIGMLDTFKRASSLMCAIEKTNLPYTKEEKAAIAIDAAIKMCNKPCKYVKEGYVSPKALEEVDIHKTLLEIEEGKETYDKTKGTLMLTLINGDLDPLTYHINLELLYNVALLYKHQDESIDVDSLNKSADTPSEELNDEQKVKDHKHPHRFRSLLN